MNDPDSAGPEPAAQLPDSLRRFGFSVDPFGSELEQAFYYASQPLQQRIDLISHLLEFGQQIVVLSGPGSIGKSALLRQVLAGARDSWRVLTLRGSASLSADTVLASLADSYNFELDTGGDDGAAGAANNCLSASRSWSARVC
ncbi:MAG: hypothetical protein KJO38_07835, partial [Gammaproteobacteria bacterium]|nr:hypothetical protein [Gammaproteobacteria bacterium]